MSDILQKASAGTMESSDAYVEIEPFEQGICLSLESVVQQQFGEQIKAVAHQVLQECGVEHAKLRIIDRGALDCVIRARVETAVIRAKGVDE